MMAAVISALSSVISANGSILSALFTAPSQGVAGGALYSLLPLLAIGVAISLFFVGIKAIRSIIWGA